MGSTSRYCSKQYSLYYLIQFVYILANICGDFFSEQNKHKPHQTLSFWCCCRDEFVFFSLILEGPGLVVVWALLFFYHFNFLVIYSLALKKKREKKIKIKLVFIVCLIFCVYNLILVTQRRFEAAGFEVGIITNSRQKSSFKAN